MSRDSHHDPRRFTDFERSVGMIVGGSITIAGVYFFCLWLPLWQAYLCLVPVALTMLVWSSVRRYEDSLDDHSRQ